MVYFRRIFLDGLILWKGNTCGLSVGSYELEALSIGVALTN